MVKLTSRPDAAQVGYGLRALAASMGDPYRMEDALLARSLGRAFHAVAAVEGDKVLGVAVYAPFPSTTRGQIGAFVTDLWVDEAARGTGLGRQMLGLVRDQMQSVWGGSFLRLNYYADNSAAAAFYDRLGFKPKPSEIWVTLEGEGLASL